MLHYENLAILDVGHVFFFIPVVDSTVSACQSSRVNDANILLGSFTLAPKRVVPEGLMTSTSNNYLSVLMFSDSLACNCFSGPWFH